MKVSIENHGVDVGTDVTAGRKRDVRKFKERENAGAKRARRVSALGKIDRRTKMMGIIAVKPVHGYGASAVGVGESNIKSQKRNLAVATGKGLTKGTSSTIAIAWTYGKEAQPDIRAHMDHVEVWLR